MKKIIHIIPTFELGGVQTGILYSLKELNLNHDYRVLVIMGNYMDLIKDLPDEIKNKIIWTGSKNIILGWFKAFLIIQRIRPAIIISSLWKSVPLSIISKIFYPKTKLYGFYHLAFESHFIDSLMLRIMALFQQKALADSNSTANFIEKKFRINKTHIVPYIFAFENTSRINKIHDTKIVKMVYFGRITKVKGVERCIDFINKSRQYGLSVYLDIYGTGEINQFKEKISHLGLNHFINFLGVIPSKEVIYKMRNYDFLLQLSYKEGMCLSVVEAMSLGLVPIVTPVGEIINYAVDKENSILYEADIDPDFSLLCEKLKYIINNPAVYEKLSSGSMNTFTNKKKYTEALLEVIEENYVDISSNK